MQQRILTIDGEGADCTIIKGRRYTIRSIKVNRDNQNVNVPDHCNSWVAQNYGTVNAFVNNKPILCPPSPTVNGESFGPDGNPGDEYVGELVITFDAGGTALVWITFYIYTS
jgi:hypothetical protein